MALIVEDGSQVASADSYISLADADTYFTNIDNSTWLDQGDTEKEAALRTAAQYLDGVYSYIGEMVSNDQALLWPRTPSSDNAGRILSITTIPQKLKDAQCELAVEHLSGSLLASTDRETQSESVGSLSVSYFRGQTGKKFPLVNILMKDLIHSGNKLQRV